MNIRTAHKHDVERAQKKILFDMICNKENWKGPIDCIIPKDYLKEFNDAVTFFTAGELKVVDDDGNYLHCQANGYYADCGA